MLQRGDNVFFCHNGPGTDYDGIAYRIIESLGLTPFIYSGITLDTKKSTLEGELRDDFYKSKAIILLLLGQTQRRDNSNIEDNWAIPELKCSIPQGRATSQGINYFVYATTEVTKEEINNLELPINVTVVENEKHFEAVLKQNLEKIITTS
jgi:hypothetical protein